MTHYDNVCDLTCRNVRALHCKRSLVVLWPSTTLCAVTAPVSEELLEPLIHLLVSSDLEVQKASSHALSNLALRGAGEGGGGGGEGGTRRRGGVWRKGGRDEEEGGRDEEEERDGGR